jgi:hypothetical protein
MAMKNKMEKQIRELPEPYFINKSDKIIGIITQDKLNLKLIFKSSSWGNINGN